MISPTLLPRARLALERQRPLGDQWPELYARLLRRAARAVALQSDEGVHEARKCLKKARALIEIFPRSRDVRGRERRACRDLGRALAAARDTLVASETAKRLCESASESGAGWLSRFAGRIEGRESLGERPDVARRLEQLARSAQSLRGPLPVPVASKRLARSYQKARDAYRLARRASGEAGALHEWRKRVKAHGYHLRLLAEALPAPLADGWTSALFDLARDLGRHHDLEVLADRLRPFPGRPTERREAFSLLRETQRRLARRAFASGAKLFAPRPATFRRLVEEWLSPWNGLCSITPAPALL